MLRRIRSLIGLAATALLVAVGLSVLPGASSPANALSGSQFDPGLIITDTVFYDFTTMTVDQIQNFLNSQVPKCKANYGETPCLKDFHADTPAKKGEDGKCTDLPAKTDQTAAMIIHDIAAACRINPRVLLVTLQKEQGLVQATNPTPYMYRAALGYGCPDSDPAICGKVWSGLFNQLYKAAGQLHWYGNPKSSFTYLKVGSNISIAYNPKASCGRKTFMLKSQATASLYYYTPYTPNAAALEHLYGSGDSCSAYGNRNFWRFYSDWFGSPIAGGFLVQSPTSDPYLIVDQTKYHLSAPSLSGDFAPLGPLGQISQQYLDSFKNGGELTRLVKAATGQLYMVAQGKKYTIASCAIATQLSYVCASAVQLTSYQLNALPTIGPATALVSSNGVDRFLIQNGVKREVLDSDSVIAEGLALPSLSAAPLSAFSALPWGPPIATDDTLVNNRTNGTLGVLVNDQYFQIAATTLADVSFAGWFKQSIGSLSTQGLSQVDSHTIISSIVRDGEGQGYLITPMGKRKVSDISALVDLPAMIPDQVLSLIPDVAEPLVLPALVQSGPGATVYLVDKATARVVVGAKDRALLKTFVAVQDIQMIPNSAIDLIVQAPKVFGPGATVTNKATKQIYLVDGLTELRPITAQQVQDLGLAKPRVELPSDLSGYQIKAPVSPLKVNCAGNILVYDKGTLDPIESKLARHYPGVPSPLDISACRNLNISTAAFGRFIRTPDGKRWIVTGGKRQFVKNWALLAALRGKSVGLRDVSQAFADQIPEGKPAVMPKPKVVEIESPAELISTRP
ncbi:MAG: hypothetical protein RLZZ626_1147 [Actinomycetota bacterium]